MEHVQPVMKEKTTPAKVSLYLPVFFSHYWNMFAHSSKRHLVILWTLLSVLFAPLLAYSQNENARSETVWEKEIQAFEISDKTNPPPQNAILFIGSSSIKRWTTLAADFPNHKVINRGFGGSQISDSVVFVDRIVIPYHPRQIFFYAGSNDINSGKTPEQVLADFKSFVGKVHAQLPETKIAFISIATSPSRWAQVEKVTEANHLIENFCRKEKHLVFIDIFHPMLDLEGKPRPEIFVKDGLHMKPEGYRIWISIITPYLNEAVYQSPK
ncbi:MAG: lipolytic protein family [Pedosphaera sp.]|nr:lipolytic protein family [Pedosphaera sp.]